MSDDVERWLSMVLEDGEGWIDLRAIDPDAKTPVIRQCLKGVADAAAWCRRTDGKGRNIYAGLARRGEKRDDKGKLDGGEYNLTSLGVFWVDLDAGTKDEHRARLDAFQPPPSMIVDSGGGTHAFWKLETPADVSKETTLAQVRAILIGLQDALGGDPAVTDPSRIFRVAGTINYPNARKRQAGRGQCGSKILEAAGHLYQLADFDVFEQRGQAKSGDRPRSVHGHSERLPACVEAMLAREPRLDALFWCRQRLGKGSPSEEDLAIVSGLLRRAPWLPDDELSAALRYRRIALAHLVKGSDKTAGYFSHTVSKVRKQLEQKPIAFGVSAARWFQAIFRRALEPQPMPQLIERPDPVQMPRISTSVNNLDDVLGGGLYGFAALVGDSGVGKSTVAFNTALIAYRGGWSVLYIAAEMSGAEYEQRAANYWGMSVDGIRDEALLPPIAQVSDGLELRALVDLILTMPTDRSDRCLLVLDSMTKIAAYSADETKPGDFFAKLSKLTRMSEGVVRFGEGRIMVVGTSELNRDKEALGRRITYSASVQLNMMQDKEQPDLVNIAVAKGRHSKKTNPIGPYMQEWRKHRLYLLGNVPKSEPEELYGWDTERTQADLSWV